MSQIREIALGVLLGYASLGCQPAAISAENPRSPGLLEVTSGPLVVRHLLTGQLEAADAVLFVTPNVGQWPLQVQRLLPNGARVSAGEVVVEFDNSNLLSNLDNQKSAVIRAETELVQTRSVQSEQIRDKELAVEQKATETAKARLAASIPPGLKADLEFERLQLDLHRAELLEREARTALVSGRATADAEIGIKELDLERARQDLRYAEASLDQVVLRAPRDGVLVLHFNRMVDRIFQGSDSAQPGDTVASLPDLSTLRVRARLFDVDEGNLRVGMPATVTLNAYPERRFGATLEEIQQVAQQPTGRSARRTFDVMVALDELDLTLMLPGMSAKVAIEESVDSGAKTLLAPRRSLELAGDPLSPPMVGSSPGSGSKRGARLYLADDSVVAVEVGACNVTHCIIENVVEGVAAGTRVRPRDAGGSTP